MSRALTIYNELGAEVVAIHVSGKVQIAEGCDLDEASKLFWDKLSSYVPDLRHQLANEKACVDEWLSKTEYLQKESRHGEAGLHRADVLALRVQKAEALMKEACSRLNDILQQDDGQAYKEARKFLERHG